MPPIRKIIHIDMDAFYASVEQRDRPEFQGKPVIVGGDPRSRGVVAACSYEARRLGIHSAMACATAYRLCPQAIFIRPRFDVYKSVSLQIGEIFLQYTNLERGQLGLIWDPVATINPHPQARLPHKQPPLTITSAAR